MNIYDELELETDPVVLEDNSEVQDQKIESEHFVDKNIILCGKRISRKKANKIMSSKPKITRTILANILCIIVSVVLILVIMG